jgi:hypothetical protein
MRLTYLDLSVSALKKCNANPHHRSTIEEKHCVAQQPPNLKTVSTITLKERKFRARPENMDSLVKAENRKYSPKNFETKSLTVFSLGLSWSKTGLR